MKNRNDLARAGLNVNSKRFLEQEEQARDRARQEAEIRRNVGRRPNRTIQIIRSAIAILQASVTFLVLFLVQGVGTVVALAAGMWLEIKATANGFAWIDAQNATGYATISILLFVLLLFIEASLAPDEQSPRFSLRIMADRVRYLLGIGDSWRPEPAADNVRSIVRLWIAAIVLFGFIGRLQDVLSATQLQGLAWHEALGSILANATLPQFVGVVGNTFYTLALALGLHFVIRHIHGIYLSLTGGVNAADFFSEEPYIDEDRLIEEELTKLYEAIWARNLTE